MSRTFIVLTLILAFCSISSAQNPLLEKKIYRKASIKVMEVEYFQTAEYLQTENGLYINDFQIMNFHSLSKKGKRKLKKILSDKNTYLEETNRPCPFIAGYGIEIKSKCNVYEIILTKAQCPKMMIKNVYTEEVMYYDLNGDCEIFSLFEKSTE